MKTIAPATLCLLVAGACAAGDELSAPATEAVSATAVTSPSEPEPSPGITHPPATTQPDRAGNTILGDTSAQVVLLTPTAGGGSRPLLDWQPVEGADHYAAYLYAPNGKPYWAWTGRTTSVHVGGDPRLREESAGPRVSAGMSWAVIAYDADLLPLAASELRPIAP